MLGPQSSRLKNKKTYNKIYILKLKTPSKEKSWNWNKDKLGGCQGIIERTKMTKHGIR